MLIGIILWAVRSWCLSLSFQKHPFVLLVAVRKAKEKIRIFVFMGPLYDEVANKGG
jgi:hypothetical protein